MLEQEDSYTQEGLLARNLKPALQIYINNREYVPPKVKPPVITKGVTADEFYDITSQLDDGPISSWTQDQINITINRIREVNCFFMRGTEKAKQTLERFKKEWVAFVMHNDHVRELLDPEASF